jgi:hypothetical protein
LPWCCRATAPCTVAARARRRRRRLPCPSGARIGYQLSGVWIQYCDAFRTVTHRSQT